MKPEEYVDQTKQPLEQSRELSARFRTLPRLILGCAIIGLLAGLHVPVQLMLLISTGFGFLWIIVKFIRDNIKLAVDVGARRLSRILRKTTIAFLLFSPVLAPGYWMGMQVNYWTSRGIEQLQVWQAPDIISKKIQRQIERRVEERVKRSLPWWYAPAVMIGAVDDYVTQVRTEIDIVFDTVNEAKPKPVHIRATAGFLKAALLALGMYSTAWIAVLFLRAYASLFGRILVASKPPVTIGSGAPGKTRRKHKDRRFPGPVIASGSQLILTPDKSERFFVRRTDLPGNATPDWHLRWTGGAWPIRFRKGLFSLDQVVGTENGRAYTFRAISGSQYIAITLADDQETVINPLYLVGFSDSVRFRTHWDFNLAMLGLHHAVSLIARGPGRLIFKCGGQPATFRSASSASAMSFSNLLLFGHDARFEIEANNGFHNYFASGCLVRPVSGSLFVAAPGVGPTPNILRTFWQLIKQVYIPI